MFKIISLLVILPSIIARKRDCSKGVYATWDWQKAHPVSTLARYAFNKRLTVGTGETVGQADECDVRLCNYWFDAKDAVSQSGPLSRGSAKDWVNKAEEYLKSYRENGKTCPIAAPRPGNYV